MAIVNTYLYFNGNCEAAFNFYKDTFGKEFQYLGRYKDVPAASRATFSNCDDEHIMHVSLPISEETTLIGADDINPDRQDQQNGTSFFSLIVTAADKTEADHLFDNLSQFGEVILPIADQFWGSYYGICIDQFGIKWKISFGE